MPFSVKILIGGDAFQYETAGDVPIEAIKPLITEFYSQRSVDSTPRVKFAWGPSSEQPNPKK